MGWSGMGGGESAKREEEELKRKLAAQRKPSRKERNHTLNSYSKTKADQELNLTAKPPKKALCPLHDTNKNLN